MIRPGLYLKHKLYRDVCIQVIRAGWYGGRLKGRGQFINLGCERSWPMGIPTKFEMTREELGHDWLWADKDETFLREARWRPFA
jgi:hypothetical protein